MRRVALVVGAAGGVGTELVKQLLAAQYEVVGTVLNASEAAQLRAAAAGIKDIIEVDLGNADNVAAALGSRIDRLDAVVVCAAISPYGPLEITPLAQLRKAMEINTISGVAVYQACLPLLRATKGRIILIGSFAGRIGLPFIGHYVASKFALEGLVDVMRREARPQGVEVILFEPGSIKTQMIAGQIATIGKDLAALTEEQAARYGYLYECFSGHLNNGIATGLEPSFVAAQVIDALHCPAPQARYQLGDDANYLCNVVSRQTDSEQDAVSATLMPCPYSPQA